MEPKSWDLNSSAARPRFSCTSFADGKRASVKWGTNRARLGREAEGRQRTLNLPRKLWQLGEDFTPHQSTRGWRSLGKNPTSRKVDFDRAAESERSRESLRCGSLASSESVSPMNFSVTCMPPPASSARRVDSSFIPPDRFTRHSAPRPAHRARRKAARAGLAACAEYGKYRRTVSSAAYVA